MHSVWLQVLKPTVILGVLMANVALPKFPVAAPEQNQATVAVPKVETLAELYRLRDRLGVELSHYPTVMVATRSGVEPPPADVLTQLGIVNYRLQQEETARQLQQRAEQAAAAAIALGNPASLPVKDLATAYTLWDKAVAALNQIPPNTFGEVQATAQKQQYEHQQAIAAYHYDTARSAFLKPIVEQTSLASRVRLTVCSLQRECRRWQGNRPPASPASLIKVPVAIALMTKLHQEGTAPSTAIWVSPSNWTEDAGSTWVRTTYPLEQIMADMISASGNIATNQLIDYIGWDDINQSLRSRGYQATRVTKKLVGEATYPANAGSAPNAITTDELTDMMVAIYNREFSGADLIEAALADQRDRNLGHAAVSPPTDWLGEKTGRNSKVLGTTTAVGVGNQRYIITATLDHSTNEAAMQAIIAGVIQHLLTHNGFEHEAARAEDTAL
ncbi:MULTISPECIES: serine hydrolase [Cyanophyceae]|uniref:serine hydrolase n=1 Tax=Cyanophyceae TaxID=3028117 RepID=UPI0016854011|nr:MULTISPECIES: serine hydrolase [Cyanophyceae]MBD1914337.1 serine hydrolase [Phormidium sp. FACHB-77]MBD2028679.1 serine hydrolase [Phormidium sp. FACHB-322]MBD2053627.1 serine hydrolase [Leptolyngbya sp. FACHB-60]